MRARSFLHGPHLLQPVGLAHGQLETEPEVLLVDLRAPACATRRYRDPEFCLLSFSILRRFLSRLAVILRCCPRGSPLWSAAAACPRPAERPPRAVAFGTPSISNKILPGRITATHCSGAPLPLPIRVSAGFLVMGLSGNRRIHTLPPRLMKRVMATRAASICRSVIQPQRMAFSPKSPKARRGAAPGLAGHAAALLFPVLDLLWHQHGDCILRLSLFRRLATRSAGGFGRSFFSLPVSRLAAAAPVAAKWARRAACAPRSGEPAPRARSVPAGGRRKSAAADARSRRSRKG